MLGDNNRFFGFIVVNVVYVQIIREFNRIMGKDVAVEINEKWPELGQQIIKLAKREVDNHLIQDFLKDQPEELPEGGFWHVDAPIIHKNIHVYRVHSQNYFRPYLFDLLLRGQKWLASQVGRSV